MTTIHLIERGGAFELRGTKRAALDNLATHLEHCVELLGTADELIVAVAVSGAWIIAPSWLANPPPSS